jgi:nucleoside-diphosphate-sugar epimerase
MKSLITGGAGFIGSRMVDAAAEKHEVVVLGKLESQVHAKGMPNHLTERGD